MVWNHRDKLTAMGIALQAVPGVFTAPAAADLIGAANMDNGSDIISAADPTQTGTVWDSPRIYLGETGTGGATIPLRGPGGVAPPALDAWPVGRVMRASGFTELRLAAPVGPTALVAGSTVSTLALAAGENAADDFYIGHPIQHAAIGSGFRQTTIIRDYVGATKTALLAETIVAPAAGTMYTRPAFIGYLQGTLGTAPPLLSISVWRGRLRYDYRDCVITSWSIDTPTANEQNQSFPALQFTFKGVPVDPVQDPCPAIPSAVLNVPVPPAKGGKFFFDRIMLGHAGAKVNVGLEAGAAPNMNQDAGQDGYDILSGNRNVELDINQMDIADFDLKARQKAQTQMPFLETWGLGSGNNVGLLIQNVVLDPLKPGGRNGYVGLTGQAQPTDVDKSVALTFWY